MLLHIDKVIIGLLLLLAICIAWDFVRWVLGGRFLPDAEIIDGRPEPQSLRELVERRRAERAASNDKPDSK